MPGGGVLRFNHLRHRQFTLKSFTLGAVIRWKEKGQDGGRRERDQRERASQREEKKRVVQLSKNYAAKFPWQLSSFKLDERRGYCETKMEEERRSRGDLEGKQISKFFSKVFITALFVNRIYLISSTQRLSKCFSQSFPQNEPKKI